MNSKYNITNLLSKNPMNAKECAKIIISHINQDRDAGKGFLSKQEMISIRDGKKDNTEEYNSILDKDRVIQLIVANIHQNILCYRIITSHLWQIFQNYINIMFQEDVIECVEWMENKNKKLNKELSILKDTLKNTFKLTATDIYGEVEIKDFEWEDLKKVDINKSKDFITTEMDKRRNLMSSSLAYQELMNKLCEEIDISYYKEKIDKLFRDVKTDDLGLWFRIEILHNHYTMKGDEYDGFLGKEVDKQVKVKYGKEHETFL